MIIEFLIDRFFSIFEFLWIQLNVDLSFISELVNIASSHLDTVINILKAVMFIVPSGVITLIPFVIGLIGVRFIFAIIWFVLDVLGSSPL